MKRIKHITMAIVSVILITVMAFQIPAQAAAAEIKTEYISEIKVGMGKTEAEAKEALEKEGYTVLDCNLNQGAEGGLGSKGKKATYIGYKTTNDRKEAITDLAVMNMNGGYCTKDYDKLMQDYMDSEIIPFVEGFISAVKEYRENYTSSNEANQKRAKAIHDMLNQFTDDDTGKSLGDLLLNETKFEMGDDAYNALSDEEKKEHADIVTIIAQANGQATLMIENLITRGSDTNDDTWVDRFSQTTTDDLIESTGKTPTDAKQELAALYSDDAAKIHEMWDDFKKVLDGYDEAVKTVNSFDMSKYKNACDALAKIDDNTAEEEKEAIGKTFVEEENAFNDFKEALQTVAVHDMLREYEHDDKTMLEFFDRDSEQVDASELYPLVASLTDGQRSGLDFVSLKELAVMALTNEDGYEEIGTNQKAQASIYEGVDRAIYEKGGVGLTSDAIRADAANKAAEEAALNNKSKISTLTLALYGVAGASFMAFAGSAAAWATFAIKYNAVEDLLLKEVPKLMPTDYNGLLDMSYYKQAEDYVLAQHPEWDAALESFANSSAICKGLTIGFSVATIIVAAVSIYFTYRDLKNYYKTEFTPQPRFIVEEKDITGLNQKGEKIVLKNQTAYYKLAETNRDSSAEFYNVLGTGNDLNGDVGKQWLSLYYAKNEAESPIIADSLKAVVGSKDIPAGYETGIHMFGEDTSFNLNNSMYVWDDSADSVNVYFKTDSNAASTANLA